MKNLLNKALVFLLLCTMAFGMVSCTNSKKSSDKDAFYLYYTDSDKTKLEPIEYKVKSDDLESQVNEVLDAMNETSDKLNIVTAKPESVEINNVTIEDDTVVCDFGLAYNEMSKVEEILCRSAVVLTLTQIDGIKYVSFTVQDTPLMEPTDTSVEVGVMKADDFVDISTSENNINQMSKYEMKIYFLKQDGSELKSVNYSKVNNQKASVEKMIIQKLIDGPDDTSKYKRTLPKDTKLISVLTKDGTCYVNFAKGFEVAEVDGCTPEQELYSLVNSLCELEYVSSVQISVDGKTDVKLRDKISLKYSFQRDLDYISIDN